MEKRVSRMRNTGGKWSRGNMRNCEKRKDLERKMERLRGKGKDEEKGE